MNKMKNMAYFVDKICTIFTVPTNRDFKNENPATYPQPVFHYFVGKILNVDDEGIMVQQLLNGNKKLKSYFLFAHIIGICEEEVLDPNKPEDAKVIEDYKKINESIMTETRKQDEKVELDINSLINLSEKISSQV